MTDLKETIDKVLEELDWFKGEVSRARDKVYWATSEQSVWESLQSLKDEIDEILRTIDDGSN